MRTVSQGLRCLRANDLHLVTACRQSIRDDLSTVSTCTIGGTAAGWPSSWEAVGLGIRLSASFLVDSAPVALGGSNSGQGSKNEDCKLAHDEREVMYRREFNSEVIGLHT